MNHKIKSLIFKFLSILPNKIGEFFYHTLQKILNRNNIIFKINSSKKSFDNALKILNAANVNISNINLLEIGSGWAPIMPYFFINKGNVKKVFSYDINKHYDFKSIAKLNSYFKKKLKTQINNNKDSILNIPDTISYYPYTDLSNANSIPTVKIDLIFSRFVLEHISPIDIFKMHHNFSKKIKNSFYILHIISPSDHRAYNDSRLSIYDFLKYSEKEWSKINTKFDYHNRLRLPQYLDIFNKLNYEVIYLNYDTCDLNSDKYKMFKALQIHKDFSKFTDEEILAGSIKILLKYNPV